MNNAPYDSWACPFIRRKSKLAGSNCEVTVRNISCVNKGCTGILYHFWRAHDFARMRTHQLYSYNPRSHPRRTHGYGIGRPEVRAFVCVPIRIPANPSQTRSFRVTTMAKNCVSSQLPKLLAHSISCRNIRGQYNSKADPTI